MLYNSFCIVSAKQKIFNSISFAILLLRVSEYIYT